MFWFILGIIIGGYLVAKKERDPLDDVVFCEELKHKHEFLVQYYDRILQSKST
jgi:hypothetical protein